MFKDNKARATACALAGGLMLGSGVGLALGGAYWMGERAQSEVAHARAARLAEAAELGFSQRALRTEMAAMGPGALALAQRQDVFAAETLRGRQNANVIGQFDARGGAPTPPVSPLPSALTRVSTPAEPFHFSDGGALAATRDLACLTDAVYYEARGEGASGQAAVAQVVLNRVRHPAFPKSVCGVVFQRAVGGYGCQFSFVCDGSMRHAREPAAWRRAEEIAARALDGAVMASIGNATHFHVAGIDPGWGSHLLRVAQVGLHVFYRFGGSAGRPGSFNGEVQHSSPGDDPTLPTADGAASAGQFILASATTTAPAPAASAPPATPTAAPAKAAAAQPKDPAPVKVDVAPKAPASAAAPAARSASVS